MYQHYLQVILGPKSGCMMSASVLTINTLPSELKHLSIPDEATVQHIKQLDVFLY